MDKDSVPKADVGISGCSVSKCPVQAIAHRTQITEARASLLSVNFPLSLIPVDCRVNHMFYVGSRALVLFLGGNPHKLCYSSVSIFLPSLLCVLSIWHQTKSKCIENKTDLPSQWRNVKNWKHNHFVIESFVERIFPKLLPPSAHLN